MIGDKNWITTAVITTDPPIKTENGIFSFTNNHAQKGPKTASDNIIIPTNAEGVDLAPMVMNIKPNPSWKNPAIKPKKISFDEMIMLGDIYKPIKVAKIPATSCKGIISTFGYFLTININIANEIGIINATKFPVIWPGVKVFPNIIMTPTTARPIQINVSLEIFPLKIYNLKLLKIMFGFV